MAYKLIYNPLIKLIILEAMGAFTRFCYIVRLRVYVTVNSGVYYSVACVQAKSICISTYDGIRGGSALVMQAM